MSDAIQNQKNMYKNHLEFLGYQINDDPDDEQEMALLQNGVKTFVKVFQSGLRVLVFYNLSDKAKNDKLPFLEFINECNDKRIAKISAGEKSLIIEMWYFCPYEKISFGEFMNLFNDERQRIVKDNVEKDFLT